MTRLPPAPAHGAISGRSDEFELLCALASARLTAERSERVAKWNLSAFDWTEFLRLAEHHGVLPLVARNLLEENHSTPIVGLPPQIEGSLRSAFESNLKSSLWFAAELGRIMQHFERRHLRALPYKGPVLAQTVYHDVALRSFSDLDLLIASADFDRAKRALAEIGYRPTQEIAPALERFWLRNGNERSFDSAAGKNLLEIQWALLPRFYAIDPEAEDLAVESLIARAASAVIGECEMPSLSAEDLFLVLCLHAAKHLWTRLIWLVDIAETLRTQTIDYAVVFSRARALGVVRILGVSFWLVQNVLQAQLPQPLKEMISDDLRVPALGRHFADRLARGATYNFESTEYFRFILQLRERRRDQCRYLWRLFWIPGIGDLAAVQLPEMFFPLYHFVRIGRLTQRILRTSLNPSPLRSTGTPAKFDRR